MFEDLIDCKLQPQVSAERAKRLFGGTLNLSAAKANSA